MTTTGVADRWPPLVWAFALSVDIDALFDDVVRHPLLVLPRDAICYLARHYRQVSGATVVVVVVAIVVVVVFVVVVVVVVVIVVVVIVVVAAR